MTEAHDVGVVVVLVEFRPSLNRFEILRLTPLMAVVLSAVSTDVSLLLEADVLLWFPDPATVNPKTRAMWLVLQ